MNTVKVRLPLSPKYDIQALASANDAEKNKESEEERRKGKTEKLQSRAEGAACPGVSGIQPEARDLLLLRDGDQESRRVAPISPFVSTLYGRIERKIVSVIYYCTLQTRSVFSTCDGYIQDVSCCQ